MIIGVQGIDHALIFKGGFRGSNVDGPTDGIFAKQDALRTFQYFDPFQVHGQWHCRQRTAPGVDSIDIHAYRLLETYIGA